MRLINYNLLHCPWQYPFNPKESALLVIEIDFRLFRVKIGMKLPDQTDKIKEAGLMIIKHEDNFLS